MKQTGKTPAACALAVFLLLSQMILPAEAAPDANDYTAVLRYDDKIQILYSHRAGAGLDDWWTGRGDIPLGGVELNGQTVIGQIYCVDAAVPFHSYATGTVNTDAGGSSRYESGYTTDRVPGYVSASPEQIPNALKVHWNELLWLVVNGYAGTSESVAALNSRFDDLADSLGPLTGIKMETAVMATKAAIWHYTNPDVVYFSTSFLDASGGNPLSAKGIQHRQFAALMARLIAAADAYAANPTPLNDTRLEIAIEGALDEGTAVNGTTYYGPFTVSGAALQDDDKIFLDLSGGIDAAGIGITSGLDNTWVRNDTLYGSSDEGPYVVRGEPFYLRVPAGYSLAGLVLHAFARTEATVTNMPMVLVHQGSDGVQDWQTVQAFIGLAHGVTASVYGEALRPLQDVDHGTLTILKTVEGIESTGPFVFRLTDGRGNPVNLGALTGIDPNQIHNAGEGLFTLSAGLPLAIGGLRLSEYQVTEVGVTNTVLYQNTEGGVFTLGRTAPVLLTQAGTSQSVTFSNVPNAPSVSIRKRSGAPGNPLIEGAEFSLRREGGDYDSGSVRTNAQGGITFAGLPSYPQFVGTYYLTEESVPDSRHDLLTAPVALEIAPDGRITDIVPAEADKALVSAEGLGTDAVTVTITDVYHQPPSTVRIHGRKDVRGVSNTEEQFGFSLTQVADLQGTPLDGPPLFDERKAQTRETLTAGVPQTFVFEELVFPEGASGAYYFKLTEDVGSASDWVYDSTSYVARVDVDPTTGLAAVSWPGTDFSSDVPPVFVNVYRPQYSIIFHGRKSISGVSSTSQRFGFALDQVRDDAGTPMGPNDRLTATLKAATVGTIAAGTPQMFTFPAIENVTAGTYYFKLTEDVGDVSGWIYDSAVHIARVTVNAGGGVGIDWLDARYSENVPPLFNNIYRPLYSVEIQGRKNVSHDTQEVFNFTLTQVRDTAGTPLGPSDLRLIATRRASTAGAIAADVPQTFTFPVIENLVSGVYYLKLTEEPGATARWTYDSTAYVARVLVSAEGAVEIAWIDRPDVSAAAPPLFRNIYSPPSGPSGDTSRTPSPPPTAQTTPPPDEPGAPGEPGESGGVPPSPHDAGDGVPPGYGDEDGAPPSGDGGAASPPAGRATGMPYTGGANVAGGLLVLGVLLTGGGGVLALLGRRRGRQDRRAEPTSTHE
ncbi:MAG: Cys-Gln thioester bond-forming surface protein [Oscillospiraceae bacterium]|nr:Cys-Gln thioester bond-forming surface protein [Oscillospiraceae bacterium]